MARVFDGEHTDDPQIMLAEPGSAIGWRRADGAAEA
jgi:hypothetical protein